MTVSPNKGKCLSDAEVESLMVPRIIDALYPVLIPVEQQDCAIQALNRARIASVALRAWRSFRDLEIYKRIIDEDQREAHP